MFGLELRRSIFHNSAVYARVHGAWLVGDKDIFNNNNEAENQVTRLEYTTQGMLELAVGFEYRRELRNGAEVFFRAQAQWENWYNFSSSFEDTKTTEDFGGPSDVGFAGFAFSIGIRR